MDLSFFFLLYVCLTVDFESMEWYIGCQSGTSAAAAVPRLQKCVVALAMLKAPTCGGFLHTQASQIHGGIRRATFFQVLTFSLNTRPPPAFPVAAQGAPRPQGGHMAVVTWVCSASCHGYLIKLNKSRLKLKMIYLFWKFQYIWHALNCGKKMVAVH